jgi:GntR family transcriptional regulator, transcriptional repressor for pyruvate dehydrogenase complex
MIPRDSHDMIERRPDLKEHQLRQLRQPRLAEIVAASLRDDILSGRLKEGDLLPRQEHLFKEFRVSLPAVREAMRILETEGLISVRRGNVGGAVVHLPTPERTAQMISMVLQSRGATLNDVSGALLYLEPICARLCAARPDRLAEVVPDLQAVIEAQQAEFDDVSHWNNNARRFHETLVARCGNETMIVVIGSLETIWSAHESSVWDEAQQGNDEVPSDSPMASKTRRAALRDHEKILAAIEAGNEERAGTLSAHHLTATRQSTLASSRHAYIAANLVGEIDLSPARQAVR